MRDSKAASGVMSGEGEETVQDGEAPEAGGAFGVVTSRRFELRADTLYVSIVFVGVLVGLAYLLGKGVARSEFEQALRATETAAPVHGAEVVAPVYRTSLAPARDIRAAARGGEPAATATEFASEEGPYFVQVRQRCALAEAEEVVAFLREGGYAGAGYMDDPGRSGLYAVRVEGIASWEEADRVARMVRTLQFRGEARFADAFPGTARRVEAATPATD